MSAEEPGLVHRERSKGGPILAMGLLLLLLLYILSPPFAYLIVGEPLISSPVCRVIYAPIIYLGEEYPVVREFYEWYGSLFPWVP
jgi:hypothetical protein